MMRQNRWAIRISFLAVLLVGLLGLWYATAIWIPMFDAVDLSTYADNVDWVDVAATMGEQAVQLFLGATSGQ